MRILFVSPRLCLPLFSGARLREYYLARALAQTAEVTYLSFAAESLKPLTLQDLPFFRDVRMVPFSGRYSPARIAQGLLGKWPLTVLNYTTVEMKAALRHVLNQRHFDLVHLDATQFAAYPPLLEELAGYPVPVVFDWHNIESEVSLRYSQAAHPLPRRIYAALTARRMQSVERRLLRESLGHIVCSPREAAQLSRIEPGARIAVVENGVDTQYFAPSQPGPSAPRRRIVFVGSMDYHANIEAAVRFTREIWPLVAELHPQWRLTLVGSRPAPSVRDLARIPGVEVTGTVDDVRPYYSEAVAAIVPLLTGGGTRLKILEAMAAAVPVVSTTLGAEGLSLSDGRQILIADSQEQWLSGLAKASDAAFAARLTAAAAALVRTRYDWTIQGEILSQAYQEWLKSGISGKAPQYNRELTPGL